MSRIAFVMLFATWSPFDSPAVLVARAAQAAAPQPIAQRAPDALECVTWRTRTLVGDDRLTTWKFAVPANGVAVPTFLDAVVRADAAIVDFVEGSSTQRVSSDIPKNLDWNLTDQERATIRGRMGTVKMRTYRVDEFPRDAAVQRSLFEFAKAMGVDTIVTAEPRELAALDALANQFGVNVLQAARQHLSR